jgi:hypothetical protein
VKFVGYAFAWDFVDDPEAALRIARLGLDSVAVAASYHATRAVSPLHPTRRVTEVPHSALYVSAQSHRWRGRRLVPTAPTWLGEQNTFTNAVTHLNAEGIDAQAWVVLTHDDDLGRMNPDLVVRNAFGEPYSYALCPEAPDVLEYCATLVEEVVLAASCSGVVLEACGPMGVDHSGTHDKVEFARWSDVVHELLSLCFCAACRRSLDSRGVDVADLIQRVRRGVDGEVVSVESALGEETANEVASFRALTTARLRQELTHRIHELRPGLPITVHASAQRWATGSFPAVGDAATLVDVATAVANCWNDDTAESIVEELIELIPKETDVGAYLRLDRGWSNASEVNSKITDLADLGVDELHLYHLGLLSRSGFESARQVIAAGRSVAHVLDK